MCDGEPHAGEKAKAEGERGERERRRSSHTCTGDLFYFQDFMPLISNPLPQRLY